MKKFSPFKVVWNDWPALALSVAVPVTWAIHGGFPLLNQGAGPLPLWFPVGGTVICTAMLLGRIGRMHRFFTHGKLTEGVITDLRIVKDRGRLEFVFEFEGVHVRAWMPVHKSKEVQALAPGDRVELLFDENKPARAIVKNLFCQ